jgi:hypothetical protein
MATATAVMLRVGEVEIVRPSRYKIPHVVKETLDAAHPVGWGATTGAGAAFVVTAAFEDGGFGQILDTSDTLGNVGQIFAGCGHSNVLQVILSSPGYIVKPPLSQQILIINARKTLYPCYSLKKCLVGEFCGC